MSTISLRPLIVILMLCAALAPAGAAQPSTKDEVRKLIAVLQSDAPQKEKADACRELAQIGTKEAVAPLAALLGDEHLSHMARYALETIPDSSVDKALRDALSKAHGEPLVGVIGSIGVRHDARAVKALANHLQDPDAEVAQAAARALGSIGNVSAAAAIEKVLPDVSATNQVAFCEGLLRCAEALAADGKRKEAIEIYDRLRGLRAPHQVCAAAWRGAVLARQTDGLPLLLQAVSSDDFAIFAVAMRIEQEMPGAEVTLALATQLKWLAPERQLLLVQALGTRGDATALPVLFDAAKKGDKRVRLAAIRALPEIGQASAVGVVVALANDSDRDIAGAAQAALGGIPGAEADAAVMTMIARGTVDQRIAAMDLAVRRRMTGAMPRLLLSAQDLEPKLRIAAMKRLGELAGPSDLGTLLDLLDKAKTPADLEACEQALSTVSVRAGDAENTAARLNRRFAQTRSPQKCALLRVLAAVGGTNALSTVRTALNSNDPDIHAAAMRALCSWNGVEAAPDLLAVARAGGDSAELMLCVRGYLRLAAQPDLAASKRLSMCRDAQGLPLRSGEKKLLLATLGSVNSVESLALIKPYLEDEAVKEEACTACVTIAEKLLQGGSAARSAPELIAPLETVSRTTTSSDLARRAESLLNRAHGKAGGK